MFRKRRKKKRTTEATTKQDNDEYADRRDNDTHMDNGHETRTKHGRERTTRNQIQGQNKKMGNPTCDHLRRQ